MKNKLLFLMISTSMIMLTAAGCQGTKAVTKPEPKAKNVKIYTVQPTNILVENDFAGELKASEETGVIAKNPGKVKEIFVKVGDTVKTGDMLFTLDSDDILAQLVQAEAGVEVAKASLERTKSSGYSQPLLQAQAECDQAKLSLEDADKDYIRTKTLFESNALSKRELDAAKSRLDSAKQRLDMAQRNLELLKGSSGPESVKIADTQLNQAISSVSLIKAQLNNMSVRAPIAGVVTAKNINVGEGVGGSEPAIVISNTFVLHAEINVPEKLVNKFTKGQKISVTVQSLEGKILEGEVSSINPTMDAATKNYKIKINLIGTSSEIKPGMYAKIKLTVDSRSNVIALPNQAVVAENGVYFVYMVKEGKLIKTSVKIGLSNDKLTEITQGLKAGDELITEGQSFLTDGELVNVLK